MPYSAAVLIPAYKPDSKLVALIDELIEAGFGVIIVVDDGSGAEYASVFAKVERKRGVVLLRHAENLGKGRAMKTGINYFMLNMPHMAGIVTADSDGQHAVPDIAAVASALAEDEDTLVLGVRDLSQMPARSKAGNTITCAIYSFVMGQRIRDTQTGLRGLPAKHMGYFLGLKGERYEMEMNMLLDIRREGLKLREIPIKTLYFDKNRGSHFNAWRDSLRVMAQFLKFIYSSLTSAFVELVIYSFMLTFVTDVLAICEVAGRSVSSFVNYNMNRRLVFKNGTRSAVFKYYAVVLFVLALDYGLLLLMVKLAGLDPYFSKVAAQLILYPLNYSLQRSIVFVAKKRESEREQEA